MYQLLKISEFAHLSGINRKTLIYYDEIGLLTPERVLDNGYRLYSYRQLEAVSVIGSLQEFGMSLNEIKSHLTTRTPSALIDLFSMQKKLVEEKISRLRRIEMMIDTRIAITREALKTDPDAILLRNCAAEALFAGDEVTCPDTEPALENAATEFYNICNTEKITYGYPFGTIISQKSMECGNFHYPSHFFFKLPEGEGTRPRFIKPAGLYLIGFEHASYNGPTKAYDRMLSYMKKQNLHIAGNSYEEFLLDEIAIQNSENHLLQISIQVQNNK